ncbi:hypothetical protein [uncultured Thermanaerothrix sp.]|uniref:hypothetical protein n=1 Tax=uncultured Thermanaerothrix sp. TaxID=1195149 RepID=UPI00260BDEB0|nr:hypothetical protein [uncultured Thermanaerothrix sp.]
MSASRGDSRRIGMPVNAKAFILERASDTCSGLSPRVVTMLSMGLGAQPILVMGWLQDDSG